MFEQCSAPKTNIFISVNQKTLVTKNVAPCDWNACYLLISCLKGNDLIVCRARVMLRMFDSVKTDSLVLKDNRILSEHVSNSLKHSDLNNCINFYLPVLLQELEVKEVRKSLTANSKEESAMQKKVTSKVCILSLSQPMHLSPAL